MNVSKKKVYTLYLYMVSLCVGHTFLIFATYRLFFTRAQNDYVRLLSACFIWVVQAYVKSNPKKTLEFTN